MNQLPNQLPNDLRDQLDRVARQRPLPSTSVDLIVGTASKRTRRRRTAAALGGVAALTATVAIGVQQLSRVDSVGTADNPTATLAVPPDATATVPASTAVVPDTTVAIRVPTSLPSDLLAGATPATLTAPVMTWTAVDADSPEALALRYGNSAQRYALATEPYTDGTTRRGLYENQDGAWVQIAGDVLPDGLRQATVSGDAIYAVGTAPATAGGEPGAVGRYDIATGEWALIPTPDGFNPYRSPAVQASVDMTIAPIDGGALVVLNRYPAVVDWQRVMDLTDENIAQFNWIDGRLEVVHACDFGAIDRAQVELGNTPGTEADYQRLQADLYQQYCTTTSLSAEQLALTAADVARLDLPAAASLWRFDGAALTPVDVPDPAATSLSTWGEVLVTTDPFAGDRSVVRSWMINPDGSFTEVFADLPDGWGATRAIDGVASVGIAGAIATETPGGDASFVDLTALVTDDSMVNPTVGIYALAANGVATVGSAHVDYQAQGVITAPTTFSDSGFDLVVDQYGGISIVEQSTGQTVTGGYRLSTDSGSVKLMAADAESLTLGDAGFPGTTAPPVGTIAPPAGTFSTIPAVTSATGDGGSDAVLAEFAVDPATLPTWAMRAVTRLVSSIDGRAYAVESIADLIPDVQANEQIEVGQIDVVDGRFLVKVWVWTPGGDGRAMILIGTPNT